MKLRNLCTRAEAYDSLHFKVTEVSKIVTQASVDLNFCVRNLPETQCDSHFRRHLRALGCKRIKMNVVC